MAELGGKREIIHRFLLGSIYILYICSAVNSGLLQNYFFVFFSTVIYYFHYIIYYGKP